MGGSRADRTGGSKEEEVELMLGASGQIQMAWSLKSGVLRACYRYRQLMATAIIANIWRLVGCVSRADLTKRQRKAIK